MNDVDAQLEALLFVAGTPLSLKQLARATKTKEQQVVDALKVLSERYSQEDSGLQLIERSGDYVLGTKAELSELTGKMLKEQVRSELTRPQLETLTIIAYRGPVTKAELEMIRGVNCTLILRNLLMRGLVEEQMDKKLRVQQYLASFDFLSHIGLSSTQELPQYEQLHAHQSIEEVLQGIPEETA